MDVTEAWELSTGADQTVAVVDTGINRAHPDLAGQVFGGYDFLDDDSDPADPNGHGTHVAGTIAAARNDIGVAGVAPDSILVPLRALGPGATDVETAKAFDWAGDHGVRIVNASLSGADSSPAEYDAIAEHPETLYVVAAGNDGDDVDSLDSAYPCAYDLPNVICVGASDSDDAPADFSNHGTVSVDLFAPGVGILSTQGTSYFFKDGTSMATPHVAGAAALVLARNPAQEAAAVKTALLEHGDEIPELATMSVTGRRANANESLLAVTEDVGAAPPFISDIDGDGVADASDNCVENANGTQADGNGNDVGDVCDDRDGDRAVDASDNCIALSNGNQADADGDGTGDVCDSTPRGNDTDGDGKPALDDACPNEYGTLANGCAPVAPATPAPAPANTDGDDRVDGDRHVPARRTRLERRLPAGRGRLALGQGRAALRHREGRDDGARHGDRHGRAQEGQAAGCGWRARRSPRPRSRPSLKVSRLKRGTHRVRISITSGAGNGTSVTKTFRVR